MCLVKHIYMKYYTYNYSSMCSLKFSKISENAENELLLIKVIQKQICHKQKFKYFVGFFFKSARQVCNLLNFNSIKTPIKTLIFLKKLFFAFLNPKLVK